MFELLFFAVSTVIGVGIIEDIIVPVAGQAVEMVKPVVNQAIDFVLPASEVSGE